ncbi:MAG: efflux RND transporter periplasmic adaptor subunit [Acidobacteria bacterium]|nr:MAG: efflux RND transporter periplasmic adaptor subunit [Acidobacteriota bacterium]
MYWIKCGRRLMLVTGLVLLGCTAKEAEDPQAEHVVTVDVAPVLSSPISLKITADALLYPRQQAAIVPKISAPVKKFYVDRGARVRAGQLLAELENRDLAGAAAENQAASEQAEANYQTVLRATVPEEVQKAELDVRAAKDVMEAQQKIYENRQALYREGAISQREVNDAQVTLSQARNQYEIAQKHLEGVQSVSREQAVKAAAAQRDAAKARYESAQAQLSYSRITSPIAGVVTDRPIYAGEMASSGAPIITVMDLSQVVARAHVSQEEAKYLKANATATIVTADGGAAVPGKVTLISPALDPASTTVEVWVEAANPGDRLKPGTSLRVEMVAQTVPSALVIPQAAVLTSPSGNTSVIVVDSENKPHKKSVTLGIRDSGNVQVTEGLESGERVVTAGAFELSKLEEGVLAKTKVQIQPPKEEEDEK